MATPLEQIHSVVDCLEDSETVSAYDQRHGITASAMLTVVDDTSAELLADHLADRIRGRVVVEIGAGIGLLGCHLGRHAKRVYCIEANPVWTWMFAAGLYSKKPRNVSFLFGAADEFLGLIRADVAIFCTHSGLAGMQAVASQFAPETIDVYGELIAAAPDRFDALASFLRNLT